jgi:hypothetical protein
MEFPHLEFCLVFFVLMTFKVHICIHIFKVLAVEMYFCSCSANYAYTGVFHLADNIVNMVNQYVYSDQVPW